MKYQYVQLDPRPGAENPIFSFGIEITVPKLLPEGVANLDHHGKEDTAETPSAVEQAVTSPLPEEGTVIATVRADADSVGAMAVLENRAAGRAVDSRLVAAIGAVDKYGPQATGFEDLRPLTVAIARKAADFKTPLQQRVAWVGDILAGKIPQDEVDALVAARDTEFAAAETASIVTLAADGRIAVVESTHRFATELGYQKAQVVVAVNPQMSVDFKDPSKGTYRKYTVCRYNEFVPVDIAGIRDELNTLDPGWGGQVSIIGSPQGKDSTLSLDQVVGVVARHLK
jgi:hypothetical protein